MNRKKLKIIVVGAEGNIGSAVCAELSPRHDLVKVGRNSGDYHADITDRRTLDILFQDVGEVDAVITMAGAVHFESLARITAEEFMLSLTNKVMGQVNVVLAGLDYINDGGSFTLTSGLLDRHPVLMGSGAATANAALSGFVAGASIEMPRGLRINVVSPGLLEESKERYSKYIQGHSTVTSNSVAKSYVRSVEGTESGLRIIGD